MPSLNDKIERFYWYEVMIFSKCLKQEGRILDEEEFLEELFEDDFGLGMATNYYEIHCKGITFNAEMVSEMVSFVNKMAEDRLLDIELYGTLEELVNKYVYDYILDNYLGWGRGEVD